jgi:hypothetical protein
MSATILLALLAVLVPQHSESFKKYFSENTDRVSNLASALLVRRNEKNMAINSRVAAAATLRVTICK